MPMIINGNSINGVLESNVAGPNYAVPYSMDNRSIGTNNNLR